MSIRLINNVCITYCKTLITHKIMNKFWWHTNSWACEWNCHQHNKQLLLAMLISY